MKLKNLSLSIKLAIIFPIIMGIIFLSATMTNLDIIDKLALFLLVILLIPIAYILELIFRNPLIIETQNFIPFPNFFGIIIDFVIYALIGLFIGWIIKKIRK